MDSNEIGEENQANLVFESPVSFVYFWKETALGKINKLDVSEKNSTVYEV